MDFGLAIRDLLSIVGSIGKIHIPLALFLIIRSIIDILPGVALMPIINVTFDSTKVGDSFCTKDKYFISSSSNCIAAETITSGIFFAIL